MSPLLPSLSTIRGTPVDIKQADLPPEVMGRCPCQRNFFQSDVEFQEVRPGLGANLIFPGRSVKVQVHCRRSPQSVSTDAASGSTLQYASTAGMLATGNCQNLPRRRVTEAAATNLSLYAAAVQYLPQPRFVRSFIPPSSWLLFPLIRVERT